VLVFFAIQTNRIRAQSSDDICFFCRTVQKPTNCLLFCCKSCP